MKKTSKILAFVLIVMTILMSLSAFSASAANIPAGTKLYLVPSANWNQSNARFAAYFFGSGEAWVSMTKVEGQSNLYEVTVPEGSWTNVIFCRMNPSASANNWNNKWNQTSDLVYNGSSNCYTVKEGTWDKGGGTWSTYGNSCSHANIGEEATCTTAQVCLDCGDPIVSALGHTYNADHLCTRCNGQAAFTVAGTGDHLGTEWDTGNVANDMTFADGVYTKVYENVAAGSYLFKVVRDHDWGTAYPDADKSYTVATSGSTVTITLTGTTVNVVVEAPHEHNFVEGKCECGEEDPNYVPPHVHAHEAVVTAPTCTKAGYTTYTCECGDTYTGDDVAALGHTFVDGKCACGEEDPNYVPPHEHNFVEGKCECGEEDPNYVPPHEHNFVEGKCECGEVDPDYVAPEVPANDYLINFSTWAEFAKGTYADGDVFKYNDVFTFIYGKNSRVDSSSKTWDDFSGTLRFSFGGKTNAGVPTKNALQITVDGAYTLKIWYVAGGAARYFALVDAEGNVLSETTKDTAQNVQYYSELEIPAAGTYYLTIPADNNYIFQIELVKSEAPVDPPHEHNFVEGKCECGEEDPNYVPPHVNSLVVGETNKIVIGDSAVDNGYGYLVESVFFVADEKAHYEFVGEGLTILVYDLTGANLCGYTGKADLEAGTYLICIAANTPATKGEFNVAVTKSEIVVPDEPEHENKLVVGENNKIVVDGSAINQNGNPIAWVPFVADEKAVYTFASETEGALVYIFNADYSLPGGALTSSAVLEPGNYIICVGNGAIGDIYVTVEKSEVPVDCEHVYAYMNCTLCGEANPYFIPNLLVVGENKVVCNEYHLVDTTGHGNPYQFTLLTVTEDGFYIFSSDKLIGVTIFTTEITDPNADFTTGTGASWAVYEAGKAYLTAGTYYIGFIYVEGQGEYTVNIEKHEHEFVEGICACGAVDPDYVAPHEHNFVEGKCECGEVDPDYVAPQPPVDEEPEEKPTEQPKLGFFDKIMAAIKAFFDQILAFFKGMFKF